MFTGDIPSCWKVKETSDAQLTNEGDALVFEHQQSENGLECRVQGVKEDSNRLDFLGEVVTDDDELESLWLASDDYPTVSHTRDEILDWVTEKLTEYEDFPN